MSKEQNKQKSKNKPQAVAPPVNKARFLKMTLKEGMSEDKLVAEVMLKPVTATAATALDYSKDLTPDLSLQECLEVMTDDIQAVNGGNLDNLEGMLTAQATALNAMFNNFAKRAIHADVMPKLDAYFRMALKAQAQCRSTVEAIAEIKYPKSATFIKQANIAQQQQVNNGGDCLSNTRTGAHEKNINPANELLTEASHETLDARGTATTIRTNPQLETVGEINRGQDAGRKSKGGF